MGNYLCYLGRSSRGPDAPGETASPRRVWSRPGAAARLSEQRLRQSAEQQEDAASQRSAKSVEVVLLETLWSKKLQAEAEHECHANSVFSGISRVQALGGGGGLGRCVFRARFCHVDVALKIVVSSSDEGDERSRVETRVSESLRHPNVIQTFQTRKTVLSKDWLDAALTDSSPIGWESAAASAAATRSSSSLSHLLPSSGTGAGGTTGRTSFCSSAAGGRESDSTALGGLLDTRASGDGFGAPDGPASAPSYMSRQEVLSRVGVTEGCCMAIIIMELGDRGTLQSVLEQQRFNLVQVQGQRRRQIYRAMLRTLREIAQGLAAMHSMGLIHCDLKPSNVLLKASRSDWRGFTAAVCDFGLSRAVAPYDAKAECDEARTGCGTLLYMAPEAISGLACKASDIYALAVIMFQMCSGTEPFVEVPSKDIYYGVKAGSLRPEWPQDLLPELQPLYEACVQFDAERRPSASEVVQALIEIETLLRLQLTATVQNSQPGPARSAPNIT